jgi:hypothetical protein
MQLCPLSANSGHGLANRRARGSFQKTPGTLPRGQTNELAGQSSAIACFRVVMVIMVVMIRFHARKARSAGRAASPLVFRKLRERTQWSLECDALRRIVIHVFRGDDFIGRIPAFDPSIERRENVV